MVTYHLSGNGSSGCQDREHLLDILDMSLVYELKVIVNTLRSPLIAFYPLWFGVVCGCGCGVVWLSSDYNTYPSLDFDFDYD